MKSPTIKFVYDRKHVGTKKKEAPVELRITYERKQKYIGTGISVLPQHWKEGYMVRDRMDADELNEALNIMMKDARKVVNEMLQSGVINLGEIPSRMNRMKGEGKSFLEFCEERTKVRQHGVGEDSKERYDRFMKFFRKWGKIVWFSDVTDSNVIAMDDVLNEKGMKACSKWGNYHRFLNSYIIDAINEGKLTRNPYKWLRIDKDKASRALNNYLTLEEFDKLKKVECTMPHFEQARDVFVFQVYTCMSYADLAAFDARKIENVDGRKMYSGRRGKTGQEYSFMLLKPALEILDKYNGKLPIISNQKYNDYLKAVCVSAGIKKPVSSHWARHTGATLLLNEGINMEVVAKILGHSSTRITRSTYAKLLDKTVADAMWKSRACLTPEGKRR
jgi:site-specific recombinase XerD